MFHELHRKKAISDVQCTEKKRSQMCNARKKSDLTCAKDLKKNNSCGLI